MTGAEVLTAPGPQTLGAGAVAPAFEGLLDVGGSRLGFSDFADREVLVLIFSSNRCPTAKSYAPRLNALRQDYGSRGVQVIALNSNDPQLYPDESYTRMVERAAADDYSFPYLVDEGQRVARGYGAVCTFHVFVLDRERRVRYEGRFDDARLPEGVTTSDVSSAIDDILAGRPVRVTKTDPFGCSLDYV